jgi:hypothetical protein
LQFLDELLGLCSRANAARSRSLTATTFGDPPPRYVSLRRRSCLVVVIVISTRL